ncbi:MAG: 16S rRNA (cytosine(1402)-N(4))-methyltransferase RsmH [Chloroflexi bacterium]|nr:16S rRNA (cytosine(1402)-N(4))-methyltransferase RsmH [Chloroflexota bacterium]
MSLALANRVHTPVLVDEVVEALDVRPGGRYIDCTLGGGGHSLAILARCRPGGQLLGIDADPEAIRLAQHNLYDFFENSVIINDNFYNLENICRETGFSAADGILFDLGLSSLQLASAERGFSFQLNGPLDMRFNPDEQLTAADIVNRLPEDKLAQLILIYGEEPLAHKIARTIVDHRPISDTEDLAAIVAAAVGDRYSKIHPATRTFQALRIAVNRELDHLTTALDQSINCLSSGGRLAVISYHSLEDRIVKNFMLRETRGCICPPSIPQCRCQHKPTLELVSRHPVNPTEQETERNPRSRSAKLRVAVKL